MIPLDATFSSSHRLILQSSLDADEDRITPQNGRHLGLNARAPSRRLLLETVCRRDSPTAHTDRSPLYEHTFYRPRQRGDIREIDLNWADKIDRQVNCTPYHVLLCEAAKEQNPGYDL